MALGVTPRRFARQVDCEVDMLFGVHRLKGIAVAYLRGRPGGGVVGHGVHLLVWSLMVVSMHLAIYGAAS